jgi:preprotein translocase subunit SecG
MRTIERLNMSTLETVLLMLLVVDAIALAVLVLLQQGKGAEVGAAFGSGSASTMFGSGGSASFFTKLTVWLAIGFFLISFGLAYTAKERAAAVDSLGIPLLESEADAPLGETGAAAGGDAAAGAVEQDAAEAQAEAGEAQSAAENAEEKLTTESESVDSDIPVL